MKWWHEAHFCFWSKLSWTNDLVDDSPEHCVFGEDRSCYNGAALHLANTKPTPSEVDLHLVVLTKTDHCVSSPGTWQFHLQGNFRECQSGWGKVTNSERNWRRYKLERDQLRLFNFLKLMFLHPANRTMALVLGWLDFACQWASGIIMTSKWSFYAVTCNI